MPKLRTINPFNDTCRALDSEHRFLHRAEMLSTGAEHAARNGDMPLAAHFMRRAASEYLKRADTVDGYFEQYFKHLFSTFCQSAERMESLGPDEAVEAIRELRRSASKPTIRDIREAGITSRPSQARDGIRALYADVVTNVSHVFREMLRE